MEGWKDGRMEGWNASPNLPIFQSSLLLHCESRFTFHVSRFAHRIAYLPGCLDENWRDGDFRLPIHIHLLILFPVGLINGLDKEYE